MPTTIRAAALLLAVLCLWPTPPHARTLKIATIAPEGTTWMREIRRGAEAVEEQTGGRLKLKFYPGGVMGNDATVYRKIRAGQLHGGAFTSGSLAEFYPDIEIYGLPFLFRSLAEVDYVRERVDPTLAAGLERGGMVPLALIEGGFGYVLSDTPVRSVGDLKGKRVWLPEGDAVGRILFQAVGISPVQLPMADVYTGLQTGLVDTIVSTATAAIALQWHTKVRYLTEVPLTYLVGIVALDGKTVAALDPEEQAALRQVMGEVLGELGRLNRADEEQALAALRGQGIEFVVPSSDAELQKWRAIADQAIAEVIAKGMHSGATLETIRAHLRQFRARQGPADGG